MKISELLRLVKLNLIQNKFKVILTSIGIIVGAATIVMVIAIGKGGQQEVKEQFKNLNAGAIDISFGDAETESSGEGGQQMPGGGGGMPSGGGRSGGSSSGKSGSGGGMQGGMPSGGGMQGGMPSFGGGGFPFGGSGNSADDRMNQEKITLTKEDMEELQTFVPDISDVSISYTTKQDMEGGELEEATSYTVAGVLSNYAELSNLELRAGEFITDSNNENKEKVCVLGATIATEIFGSAEDAYDETIYIDNRPYIVNGVLESIGSVSSGISADEACFIPYETGTKYLSTSISPTITVIAEDINNIDTVKENIETVLAETYPNTEFTITDAGSKMEAASASNNTLTMLLFAMATIVFIVGGIGIMNVLFVSVKERTKEIGILKAMGCSKRYILLEFLLESCVISLIGGILGVGVSYLIAPLVRYLGCSLVMSLNGVMLAIGFAVLTGTLFGFYPALKAAKLVPVQALNEE